MARKEKRKKKEGKYRYQVTSFRTTKKSRILSHGQQQKSEIKQNKTKQKKDVGERCPKYRQLYILRSRFFFASTS